MLYCLIRSEPVQDPFTIKKNHKSLWNLSGTNWRHEKNPNQISLSQNSKRVSDCNA